MKKEEGLYSSDDGGVRLDAQGDGTLRFSADFRLPAKAAEGEYEIRLYGFGEDGGRLMDVRTLKVEQVGMARWIHSMAQQHGLIYGILAVAIALAAGLLTGFLFGLGSKGGH
jgi:hypothetical protein